MEDTMHSIPLSSFQELNTEKELGRELQQNPSSNNNNNQQTNTSDLVNQLAYNSLVLWRLVSSFILLLMTIGFILIEIGSTTNKMKPFNKIGSASKTTWAVNRDNTINIYFRYFIIFSTTTIVYFLFGFAWAYGSENQNNPTSKFIGSGLYALSYLNTTTSSWFYEYLFAVVASSIFHGAVTERTKPIVHIIVATYIVFFPYPVVSHWVWSNQGWLSSTIAQSQRLLYDPNTNPNACGFLDFSGSSNVYMFGGIFALAGSWMIGPRLGRFELLPNGRWGRIKPMPAKDIPTSTLGCLFLIIGWYGANWGRLLSYDGNVAALVAITTTISLASSILVGTILNQLLSGHVDLGSTINFALVGLTSISASCAFIYPWMALFIGGISAILYLGASWLLKYLKIDDPLDAVAINLVGGLWGSLCVGIFGVQEFIEVVYGCTGGGNVTGYQFAAQIIGCLGILGFGILNALFIFAVLRLTTGLRLSEEVEVEGLDLSEHGAVAYELTYFTQELQEQREDLVPRSKKIEM